MTDQHATRIRIDLARGHWALGERDEALECLERAAADSPRTPDVVKLIEEMLLDGPDPRLEALLAAASATDLTGNDPAPSPIATPTLAQLLAEQGHHVRAREVAEQSLLRNPDDSRARELHRQLAEPEASSPGSSEPVRSYELQILEQLLARIQKRGSRVRHHDFS